MGRGRSWGIELNPRTGSRARRSPADIAPFPAQQGLAFASLWSCSFWVCSSFPEMLGKYPCCLLSNQPHNQTRVPIQSAASRLTLIEIPPPSPRHHPRQTPLHGPLLGPCWGLYTPPHRVVLVYTMLLQAQLLLAAPRKVWYMDYFLFGTFLPTKAREGCHCNVIRNLTNLWKISWSDDNPNHGKAGSIEASVLCYLIFCFNLFCLYSSPLSPPATSLPLSSGTRTVSSWKKSVFCLVNCKFVTLP